jgi:hypothetical protein
MHAVTCKLNNDARLYAGEKGTTFFLGLGEKHYNFKTKEAGYTNYDAAIFAKPTQVQFYTDNLKAGCIVSVSGSSIIMENDEKYGPKLALQDAKLTYCFNPATPMPNQVRQQMAPQQQQQQAPVDDLSDIPFAPIGLAQDNCFIYCI